MDIPYAGVLSTILKNLIFVGMNIFGPGELNPHNQDEEPGGLPGDSRAYDARTGKKLWEFHAIPHDDGEANANDWAPGARKGRAGEQQFVLLDDR